MNSVAGIMPPLGDDFPADSPAYWSVYLAVVDAEPAARAGELGGTILVPPQDIPAGRYAALPDPQGALSNVIALASPVPADGHRLYGLPAIPAQSRPRAEEAEPTP